MEDLITQYRNTNVSLQRWAIWDVMTKEQKMQYHLEKFRSKPEWQKVADVTRSIRSSMLKSIVILFLKTKVGRWWLERREKKFWEWAQGANR